MQKPTKILFWITDFPTYSETFIRDQIVQVIRKGVPVSIFTEYLHLQHKEAIEGYEQYDLLGKTFVINNLFPLNRIKRFTKAIKLLLGANFKIYFRSLNFFRYGKKALFLHYLFLADFILKNNITVIHAHFGPNGESAAIMKEIGLSIKLVTTFHGFDIREGLSRLPKIVYPRLFKKADHIIAISNYNFQSLLQLGAKESTIVPLPNGIDTSFFKKEAVAKGELIRLFSVGRLVPEKSYPIALKALQKVRDANSSLIIEYHIVGDGPELSSLQQMLQDLKLEDLVHFHGRLTSIETQKLFGQADAYLLSSQMEALPTVLLEAMSSELPILATDVGGVKAMVADHGVVVPKNDVDAYASGLQQLLDKRQHWASIGQQARDYVIKNYDIAVITDKLLQYYNE